MLKFNNVLLISLLANALSSAAQPAVRPSTASPQVQVLDTAFRMPQLQRTRRVWVYLPAGYASSRQRYPVLYLQDGQSVFDATQATGREGAVEWQVDETLDAARRPCIVVAVAADATHRMQEYNPHDTPQYGPGEGRQYLRFLVETLKPYVDQHYRTQPDRRHTALAGSSMGGLLTFYGGLYYPEVFGSLGVFSPSFWLAPDLAAEIRRVATPARQRGQRYYFYAGGRETRQLPSGLPINMAADMQAAAAVLRAQGRPTVQLLINPEGRHGAQAWQQAFPQFYKWLR
ncbi:MAG TPA: alpha/beta hydrolase-fold protein [Hymenobacter sp.]|uniref:alpha/beta hydrolase n=1 Tax=Hymenobacter sp. TaxID=1898978 RepID=UPI002D80BFDD|nr:alpha/beta hydrolase-fold protein [Hymenobacter sp.]HET9503068.1 alpha/beta hydrolase-fold protein [Hymenobacter sp.]